jgi:hypothetical protein
LIFDFYILNYGEQFGAGDGAGAGAGIRDCDSAGGIFAVGIVD